MAEMDGSGAEAYAKMDEKEDEKNVPTLSPAGITRGAKKAGQPPEKG